jgi:superfamily II DNA helicase RecQ
MALQLIYPRCHRDPEAIYINRDHKTPELMEKILNKEYRTLLIGPEQLHCDKWRALFRNEEWTRDLYAIIVDEAHVVHQWGTTFRPVYETLREARYMNVRRVPVLAMSATLPVNVCNRVIAMLDMRDPAIINVGSARPNIFLRFLPFLYGMARFIDVWNLLPKMQEVAKERGTEGEHSVKGSMDNHLRVVVSASLAEPFSPPSALPKTVIYVNSRSMVLELYKFIRSKMPTVELRDSIQYHHSSATDVHRHQVEAGLTDGTYRVVVATDSLGMGQDIRDIKTVIQVKANESIPAMAQRIGRAGRSGTTQAEGIVLFERALLKRRRQIDNAEGVVADGGDDEVAERPEEPEPVEEPVSTWQSISSLLTVHLH